MSKIDPTLTADTVGDTAAEKTADAQTDPQTYPQTSPQTDAHGEEAGTTRRDVAIILAVLGVLALWGGSVALWGIPGLYIPAVAMVPVVWALLLLITRG